MKSKANKKLKAAKTKAWRKRMGPYRGGYYRRVMLLDPYLQKADDGTVEFYASLSVFPPNDYGTSYMVAFHGEHGTQCIKKWFYYPPEISVEDVWKEACAVVDEIAKQEIIDTEYLSNRGFEWD